MSREDDVKRAREWLADGGLVDPDDGDWEPHPSFMLAALIAEVRAETLEEAAKVAECTAEEEFDRGYEGYGCDIAKAIRALKDKP